MEARRLKMHRMEDEKGEIFALYRDYHLVGKEMKEDFVKSKLTLTKNSDRFVFKFSEDNEEEGLLGLAYGSFLMLTMLDRFELKAAFSIEERKKIHNTIIALLEYVEKNGFDVSPFAKDEVNKDFFGKGKDSFIESLTWSMSCFLYAVRAQRKELLEFTKEEEDRLIKWIAHSLIILVDNVVRSNGERGYTEGCTDYIGWGPLTRCSEASLYFTHSVCETFGDIEDTMLGNEELEISKDWELIARINEVCSKILVSSGRGTVKRQVDIVDRFQQICLIVGENVFKKYEKSLGKKFFYADGSEIANNEQISYSMQSPVLLNQLYVVLTAIYVNYHKKVEEDEGEEAFKELSAKLKNAVDLVYETYTDLQNKSREHIVNREYAMFTERHPQKEIAQRLSSEKINVAVLEALIIKARAMIITYVSKYPEKEIGDVLKTIENGHFEDQWLWSNYGYNLQQTERSISAILEFYDYYEQYQKPCAEKNSKELQGLKDEYEAQRKDWENKLKREKEDYQKLLKQAKQDYEERLQVETQAIEAKYKLEGIVRAIVHDAVRTSFVDLFTSTLDKIAKDNKTAKDTLTEDEKKVKQSIANFISSFLIPFNFASNNARANSSWAEADDKLVETMKGDLSAFIEEWMYRVCKDNHPGAEEKSAVLSKLFADSQDKKQ